MKPTAENKRSRGGAEGFTQSRKGFFNLSAFASSFAPLREIFFVLLSAFACLPSIGQQTDLKKIFLSPPESAKPWVFWYWMQASVSREGITADLKAMRQAGIAGAYLMPIKGPTEPPLYQPATVQLTPAWWDMIRFAAGEAKRYNIKFGIHLSDGFALAGGPWISPDLSMQKIVWSQTTITGGKLFNDSLPQPETLEGYYKDIAVFAYPSAGNTAISTLTTNPRITSSKPDSAAQLLAQPGNKKTFGCDEQCWIQYGFDEPFTCRTITIHSRNNYQSNRLIIQVSDDGQSFKEIGRLEPPRHGWQDWDASYTHSIPAASAKFFRFVFDKTGTEPGAEDLDAAKWKPSLRLTGIELSSAPRIHQFEGKSGEVWRISRAATAEEIPDSICVPLKNIINLSDKLDKNGRLVWNAPPGNWTILRMGHTSTGHKNETAGGGKGLECDKFNPVAVTLQYDKWFGETVRQIGPAAKDVLKLLHVDSWECGSQNWSVTFRDEFRKRRRYDVLQYLPVMAGVPVQDVETSERFLLDVRKTIAELVNDNFYVPLKQLAHKQGFFFSAESVAPTMVSDGMLHYKNVDFPMGEFWLRSPTHDKPNDMLDAISGAHIYGKQIVQAEGFTELRMAWDEHPGMLKTLGDRNFAAGINRLSFHVFMHNPWMDRKPGMTLDAIGLYFQRDQTWWKQGRAWVEYVSRCQALLQSGKPVVDIAVFTGEDLPRRSILPDRLVPVLPGIFGKEVVEQERRRLSNDGQPQRQLPAGVNHSANMADPENWIDPLRGYAYDLYNEDALMNLSKVRDGKIELSTGASYKLLVFPGAHKMSPNGGKISKELQSRIVELTMQGATIIFNGHFLSPLTVGKGKIMFGPYESSSFSSLGIEPDVISSDATGSRAQNIAWTHRAGQGFDIYFISNQENRRRDIELSLRVNGKLPEIWDPVDGSIKQAASWRIKNGRTIVSMSLEANASCFIVFQQQVSNTVSKPVTSRPTQSVALTGPWSVQFDTAYGGPARPVVFSELTDWSRHIDSMIRYYSGTAVYSTDFNWNNAAKNAQVLMNVGDVANIAEVYVNGVSCGVAWTPPYRVDITKALRQGNNFIKIEVSNTWANRLIGDHRLPEDKRVTNTIAPYRLENKPLLPAGLLGPVIIEINR
ncbi:MAG: glycosyl hydrolase [Chitinophagaceae bacterium]